MCRHRGRCGQLVAIWLCVTSALLTGACTIPPSPNSATVATPAPAESALSIFEAQGSSLVAYRARDGSTRWTSQPTSEEYDGDYRLWYGAGIVLGDTFPTQDPDHSTLLAVRASDGHPLWHLRMPEFAIPIVAIAGDYVVLESGDLNSPGPLLVIRASDGAQVHAIPLTAAGWLAADGDTAFLCSYDAVLTAFRLSDGQALWTIPVAPGSAIPGEGCPVVAAGGGIVFCQVTIWTPQGQRMGELAAVRESDGHRLWQKPVDLDVLQDGIGYYFDEPPSTPGQVSGRSLVAYRAADGAILWQIPAGPKDTSNIAGEGNVLVFSQGADLRAVRASDGASVWQYVPPADRSLIVEAVASDLVFALSIGDWGIHNPPPLGTDTREYLLVLGAGNGRLYWQMPLAGSGIMIGDAS